MKCCRRCKVEKPIDAFGKNKRKKDGLDIYCKDCARDENREAMRRFRAKNHDKVLADSRRRYAEHPEQGRRYALKWRNAHLDQARENARRWIANHPEWNRGNCMMRRARVLGAPNIERFTREEIWERDGGICHICGRPADESSWHLDHKIPLVHGGEHTRANVGVAHPLCNMHKHTRLPATGS